MSKRIDHAEVAPWNAPYLQVLRKAGKPCYWLLISEGEAHVLAAGLVNARLRVAAHQMTLSLEEFVLTAGTGRIDESEMPPIDVPRKTRGRRKTTARSCP
ncbi:MAG TPA: hypothetical protein VH277_12990 [Gemmatimonadaceae bacterium]|nr:hypothetical protein [Gemmatimonadaceae bacterium]